MQTVRVRQVLGFSTRVGVVARVQGNVRCYRPKHMQMCAMHVHAHPMFWCAGGAGLAHLQGFQTMILMSDVLLTPLQLAAQALIERIRPVMTVNKLDRCFLELMLDGEEAFMGFRRTIESANVIMATYADELLGDTQVRAPARTAPAPPGRCDPKLLSI